MHVYMTRGYRDVETDNIQEMKVFKTLKETEEYAKKLHPMFTELKYARYGVGQADNLDNLGAGWETGSVGRKGHRDSETYCVVIKRTLE